MQNEYYAQKLISNKAFMKRNTSLVFNIFSVDLLHYKVTVEWGRLP